MYVIGFMAFVLFLSSLIGMPVLPQLSKELGAGVPQAAAVVSAALATVVVVQFFAGFLADVYSKRTLILAGALMGSATSFLCVAATHWVELLALRVAGGVADAITMPALLSITASLGKDRPGKSFGILRASQGLSFVIGPFLGGVCSLVSLRFPFIVDGVLSLAAFAAAGVLMRDNQPPGSEHHLRGLFAARPGSWGAETWLSLLMGVSGLFAFGVLSAFMPVKSALLGLTAWRIGVIMASGALAFSGVSLAVGALSDRTDRRALVLGSQLVIVGGCVGLAVAQSFVSLLTFYCVFCLGEAATYLLSFVYAARTFDPNRMGAMMGAFDSLMDFSLVVAPVAAIALQRATGSVSFPFLFAMLPAIVAFGVLARWPPGGRGAK